MNWARRNTRVRSRRNSPTCWPWGSSPPREELARIAKHFADPDFVDGPKTLDRSDPDFALWVDRNTHRHKHDAYVSAVISLKPVGGIPGDATSDQMRLVAKLARDYSFDELRVMHTQNLLLPHVRIADLHAVWAALDDAGLGAPNMDTIEDIIACPGLDYCSLAKCPLDPPRPAHFGTLCAGRAHRTGRRIEAERSPAASTPAGITMQATSVSSASTRKGTENYQLSLGGSEAEDVSLAKDHRPRL